MFCRRRHDRRRALKCSAALLALTALVVAVAELTSALGSYRHLVRTHSHASGGVPTGGSTIPEFVSINASRGLTPSARSALLTFSSAAGMSATIVHQGTVDLLSVVRNGSVVKTAPIGASYPMSTLAVDPAAIAATTSNETAAALTVGSVVVGATSALVDDLRVGDSVTIAGWNGTATTFSIGAIEPDPVVAGTELMMSAASAQRVGLDRPFSMRVWGFATRDAGLAFEQAVKDAWSGEPIRVRSSWVDPLFDDTVPQSRIKQLLGEFWLRRGTNGRLQVDPAWKSGANAEVTLPIIGTMRCHQTVAVAAAAALNELRDAGLAGLIYVADTRRSGGCFSARVTRSLTGNSGHNLSRHTWGAAIDLNPTQNPYGGRSRMDHRVIDAFARQGFVWGGNFLIPDPMHFEYVGAPS